MDRKTKSDYTCITLIALMAITGMQQASAVDGVWTGAGNAIWTNTANWSSATYPGETAGESATFDSAGNGQTTLDLAGLSSIDQIIFNSSSAASYILGTGGAGAQTLVWEHTGDIILDGNVVNPQQIDAAIQLSTSSSYSTHTLRNDSENADLTVAGPITGGTGGTTSSQKILIFYGAGNIALNGDISNGGGTYCRIIKNSTGILTLGGNNTFGGDSELYSGTLKLTHPAALNDSGRMLLRSSASGEHAMIEMAHDGSGETPFRIAMGVFDGKESGGALVSGVGSGSSGINHTVAELGLSAVTMDFLCSSDVLSGSPSITVQSLILNGGSAYTCTLNPTTADCIIDSTWISTGDYPKTLDLGGTAAGNRVDGVISNGINTLSINKSGSSVWTLMNQNIYTGTTSVEDGSLVLSGTDGMIANSSELLLAGGTLLLDNTANYNGNRLDDSIPVTLYGGTLSFSHSGGATDYSETAGALTVKPGASTISVTQADTGHSTTLTFDSLVNSGGTIDFTGDDLGVDSRNQILFTTPPALTAGIIGPWATVNGTNFATYGPNGVTAYTPSYTNIAARGPDSIIPDDENSDVKILSDGTSGPVTLAGADTNRISSLTQANTTIPATVDMAAKTLQTSLLVIDDNSQALTVGTGINSGTLQALSAGGFLSFLNNSTNALTINSVIADNGDASSLATMGSGPVIIRGECQYTGTTSINGDELTFAGHDVAQTLAGEINGAGTLIKSGTNELHLLGSNSYTGPTIIREGVVRPDRDSTFGTSDGGVFIEDGATLDIGCSADVGGTRNEDELNFGDEVFTISGDGVDGNGAIVCYADVRQLAAFGQIALAADASIGGSQIWRISNNSPSITLNDHTLTKKGSNIIDFYNINIYPGEGHIVVEDGMFRLLYYSDIHGSETNTLTVKNNAILDLYKLNSSHSPLWTLNCEDGAIVEAGNQTYNSDNEWAGPVYLGGELNLTANGTYHMTFSGEISGTGSIVKTSNSIVTLSSTNNTYTGTTAINDGIIVATSAGSLSGYDVASHVTVAASAELCVQTGDGISGWNSAQLDALHDNAGFADNTAVLEINTSSGDLTHTGNITKPLALTKTGSGLLDLAGNNSFGGALRAEEGTLVLSGSNTLSGTLTISDASVVLSDANENGTIYVNSGDLQVSGSLNQGSSYCYVTGVDSSKGMLRIADGGFMTGSGRFTVGRYVNSSGALYIDGGTFIRNTPDDTSERFVFGGYSEGGYGYLNMNGGLVDINRLQFGPSASSSGLGMAIGRISGGTLDVSATVVIGYNAYSLAVLTLDGGVFDHANTSKPLLMGYSGGRGEINLTGGTILNDGQTLEMRRGSGNATNLLNLCAGTVSLTRVLNKVPGIGWVNFSGGTLKTTAATTALIEDTMTGVYSFGPHDSFAGGAVIDTDIYNVSLVKPVEAPAGNGVYAISLSEQGSGYVGEPYVSITGGGGSGAAAVANMVDDGTGEGYYKVGSITITSPGTGYITSPTVTLVRGGGDAVEAVVGNVTIAPNTSGGLTKLGSGTLTLAVANSYTGTTTVTEGTLLLDAAGALADGSEILLNGGTLDLNGYTVTNTLNGTGTLANGTVHAVISPAGAGTIGSDSITLSSATVEGEYIADVTAGGNCDFVKISGTFNLNNMTLEIVDPDQLNREYSYTLMQASGLQGRMTALNLPDDRWRLAYYSGGTVKLVYESGTVLILR